MNKIKFKTRCFETIYFTLFGIVCFIIFLIMAINVYTESFIGFVFILICSIIIFLLSLLLALLHYQYCVCINNELIFRCPLYIIKKIKINEVKYYARYIIHKKKTNIVLHYPVIRILLDENTNFKEEYLCNKKSTCYYIYDKKDNYNKFIKLLNQYNNI